MRAAAKRCPRCRERKPLWLFYVCRSNKDGYSGYCRVCTRLAIRESQQRQRFGVSA